MAHQGNGKPVEYRVSFSGEIAEQLKALKKRADAAGLGSAYLDALHLATHRTRYDPWGLGELVRRLPHLRLSIHIRVIKPLLIEFGIHEELPLVLIKRVMFMP